jgi:polysaccharide pyruvyl transferase WcaK-like protein
MTEILRSLDLLVTSRYHAAVLSLEEHIPQIAVGHDPRLTGLYKDLEMENEYLINYENSGQKIWKHLSKSVDELLENPRIISERLIKGFNEHLARSNQNHIILKEFLIKGEWDVGN